LGPRAFDFANLSPEELELRKISSPHTQRLASELKLLAQVAVRRGLHAVIIEWDFHGPYGGVWIGVHCHLHASALGKAIIAYLSDVEFEMLFRGRSLNKITPNTICSFEALKAHLAEVRAKGFAVNNEEDILGRTAVAAPIFNHVGYVIASVCVQGLTAQIPDWQIPKLADKVICAAREISRDLAPQG
jgi:DNA-binding IclR family transcriptional regulator